MEQRVEPAAVVCKCASSARLALDQFDCSAGRRTHFAEPGGSLFRFAFLITPQFNVLDLPIPVRIAAVADGRSDPPDQSVFCSKLSLQNRQHQRFLQRLAARHAG